MSALQVRRPRRRKGAVASPRAHSAKSSGSQPMFFPLHHGTASGGFGRDSKQLLCWTFLPRGSQEPTAGKHTLASALPRRLHAHCCADPGLCSAQPDLWPFESVGLRTGSLPHNQVAPSPAPQVWPPEGSYACSTVEGSKCEAPVMETRDWDLVPTCC